MGEADSSFSEEETCSSPRQVRPTADWEQGVRGAESFERAGTLHQRVRRERVVQNFPGGFDSRYRQCCGIQEAELDQDRSLVPIDMFVSQLVAAETNDGNQWNFDPLAG